MSDPGLDAVLARMWEGFRPLAASRVDALETYVSALQAGTADDGLRADAASAAHKLAGALGSYGRGGSDEAARLETLLGDGGSGPRDPLQMVALVRSLRASVDR